MDVFVLMADSMTTRLLVCGACFVVGILLILAGRNNIQTRTAEESGKRRFINSLFGRSNTYEGQSAVTIGITRIVMGVLIIIFGIVFIFVGPFLA